MAINDQIQIVCGQKPACGFRVDDGYFVRKPKFMPGICPRCGGILALVRAHTNTPAKATMDYESGAVRPEVI